MRPAWGPSALLILFSSRFCLDVDDYRVVDSDVAHAERIVHVSPVKRCADCQTLSSRCLRATDVQETAFLSVSMRLNVAISIPLWVTL